MAYSLSLLLGALNLNNTQRWSRQIHRVHLLWHTRSFNDLRWIKPLLESAIKSCKSVNILRVIIDINVTKGQTDAEPLLEEAFVGSERGNDEDLLSLPPRSAASSSGVILQTPSFSLHFRRGRANLSAIIHSSRDSAPGPLLVSGEHHMLTEV